MNKYQEELDMLTKTAGFTSNTLQELVDRATPKKPIKDEPSKIRYVPTYVCPSCGQRFSGMISNFCYHCGQKLDWVDE